jgi:hypothetical protein
MDKNQPIKEEEEEDSEGSEEIGVGIMKKKKPRFSERKSTNQMKGVLSHLTHLRPQFQMYNKHKSVFVNHSVSKKVVLKTRINRLKDEIKGIISKIDTYEKEIEKLRNMRNQCKNLLQTNFDSLLERPDYLFENDVNIQDIITWKLQIDRIREGKKKKANFSLNEVDYVRASKARGELREEEGQLDAGDKNMGLMTIIGGRV